MKTLLIIILVICCLGCENPPCVSWQESGVIISKNIERRFINPDSYYLVIKKSDGHKIIYDGSSEEYLLHDAGDAVTIQHNPPCSPLPYEILK